MIIKMVASVTECSICAGAAVGAETARAHLSAVLVRQAFQTLVTECDGRDGSHLAVGGHGTLILASPRLSQPGPHHGCEGILTRRPGRRSAPGSGRRDRCAGRIPRSCARALT